MSHEPHAIWHRRGHILLWFAGQSPAILPIAITVKPRAGYQSCWTGSKPLARTQQRRQKIHGYVLRTNEVRLVLTLPFPLTVEKRCGLMSAIPGISRSRPGDPDVYA